MQVLRYSALVAGLIYGLYHQSSLNTQAKHAEIDREYKRKESLIEQAKTEWQKKTMPLETKSGSTGSTFSPPVKGQFGTPGEICMLICTV